MTFSPRLSLIALGLLLMVAGCSQSGSGGVTSSASPTGPDLQIANSSHRGERLELAEVAVKGKTTVFEFYSDRCGPCLEMARALERLAGLRPDLGFRRLNIDRPGQQQIDFHSPLAEQWKVEAVPPRRKGRPLVE